MRLIPSLLAAATGLVLTTVLAPTEAQAQPDLPPQEPGVTLRVFDVQVGLEELCVLKPGQTPNVDKLMPTIDWSTTDQFEIADNFVSEVTGNLDVENAGTYEFRLTSDDGSRLRIDGSVVVDHDGLHAPTPATGSVELTAGYHALRIDHFDAQYDNVLRLEWRPPGAADFTLVPNSALSTDADVVRVTAPGRKECEASGDTPGDGMPLTAVHPDHTLTNLRPEGFEPQVSGMDWLPDGRLAITTWGGSENELGEVYLLSGVTGATDPSQVDYQRIASGLTEPMGIKHVDGKLYVSEKTGLTELNDTDGDGVTDEYRTIATWPYGGNFHEFAFGLLYRDGYFYLNLSVAIDLGGATTDPQPAPNRGTTVKVHKDTGEVSYVAGGLRTPHGIGWGPDGEVFVTDNQGGWLPSSKLVHIKQDRFFNHYTNPAGPFDSRPVTQPVLWLPQNEIANSPSNPVQLTTGPFAGQLVFGDVTYGGLQRAYLEKIGGEYQGAVFRMTQGLEAGVSRISIGPDGAIYTGGIGAGGNWGQPGKLDHGLQKLAATGSDAFDILAMRAVEGGFELEYTQPLSAETAADLVTKYEVSQWRYEPTEDYGGPKIDQQTLTPSSATLSADGRTVVLRVPGLLPGRVVHVRSPRPFAAESGEQLWSTEAWYTLNRLAGGGGAATSYEAERAALSGGAAVNTNHPGYSGTGFVDGYWNSGAATEFTVDVPSAGAYNLDLRYANGPDPFTGTKSLTVHVNGERVRQTHLPSTGAWSTWADHTETLTLAEGVNTVTYAYGAGDTGNVNLDKLTVSEAERIVLFDGSDLDAWEARAGGPATWPVADGSMESLGGDIRTKERFQDFRLHVEWYEPQYPPDVTGQARGNSGVFLQERYEIQVLESHGNPLAPNEAGAIYNKKAPDVNAAAPMGEWQTYDITFRAARFDAAGNKIENARVTVVWNGILVHDNVEIDGGTGDSDPETPEPGAIRLQDHGDPGDNPRYRNIWIEPM
ncbi:family 16 glycoside hydrolase [Actinophytocola gossypii]|uniref:DUF1080 domain-containing protein n=1 Tax=Actinophytocola gossypii TaxID=2812003 RepID=A0ABT2J937_9PSEU|nr:family 16 glycoside hydrolase [Actinophytocola gossypii]MCT2584376.1 DUF1080 domain-containing protein [Actinophytocola gossypii]